MFNHIQGSGVHCQLQLGFDLPTNADRGIVGMALAAECLLCMWEMGTASLASGFQ